MALPQAVYILYRPPLLLPPSSSSSSSDRVRQSGGGPPWTLSFSLPVHLTFYIGEPVIFPFRLFFLPIAVVSGPGLIYCHCFSLFLRSRSSYRYLFFMLKHQSGCLSSEVFLSPGTETTAYSLSVDVFVLVMSALICVSVACLGYSKVLSVFLAMCVSVSQCLHMYMCTALPGVMQQQEVVVVKSHKHT